MNKKGALAVAIILAILVIDQVLKIWIKTHFMLGDSICVCGDWFYLHFVENKGMAFGMQFAGDWGKLCLSLFRIFAVAAIAVFLCKLCKRGAGTFLIVCVALVWAGAVGNIIDSVFYGVIFDSSIGNVATFMPAAGGYSTWLHGHVVDMFYFPLINSHYPSWFPFVGGEPFVFFRPVFNVADAAISVGVALLLLFQRNQLSNELSREKK